MGDNDEPAGVVTKDIFGYDSDVLHKGKIEFYYNREDH